MDLLACCGRSPVNLAAVAAMAEDGIDMTAAKPKVLTDAAVKESDVVTLMGFAGVILRVLAVTEWTLR
jgi:protein-tyrosine-phosphatase